MARKKAVQPANAGAEAIMPLTDFRGDPWKTGDKNAIAFRAGVLSSPVPAEFAQQMRDERKAASRVTVTNLDGSPVKRGRDGWIEGEPLKVTDEERAALPALDPSANDDPATYTTGKVKP
jgi:hypothetical protein